MKLSSALLYFVACIVTFSACNDQAKQPSKSQKAVIYYLYNRSLLADTFSRIAWKMPVDFRGFDPELGKLYFLFKRDLNRAKVLQAITLDTSLVEFAPCETGMCNFGGLRGNIDGYYAFRTPQTNLRIDTQLQFKCNLKVTPFTVSFTELTEAMDSSVSYNTSKYIVVTRQADRAANIGRYISRKGKDPVVKRLCTLLTKGLVTNEEKAQKFLDFVSTEIDYSYEDYWYQAEVTQRAHEVLIAGEADCSGKSTLLASLLEQSDIPYCLLYFDHHVNIGIQGKFASDNGYSFKIDQTDYYMAETTVPKFKIGKSKLQDDEILKHVLYYQEPSKSGLAYVAGSNQLMLMLDETDEDMAQ